MIKKGLSSESLVVAYFLARFDAAAYASLGYKSKAAAHVAIGNILGINPNTLKLRRDDFDPIYGHRAGWHQYTLSPRLRKIVESFQEMSIEDLSDLVHEILANPNEFVATADGQCILGPIDAEDGQKKNKAEGIFTVRGPTGRAAELFFVDWHRSMQLPFPGMLLDKRDFGGGYDFLLVNGHENYLIEVKGMQGSEGGIVFTSKEWSVAKASLDKFFLVIVRNLSTTPVVDVVQNPAVALSAKKYVYRPVQICWTVSNSALAAHRVK